MTDEEEQDLRNDLRHAQNQLESERRAHGRTHDLLRKAHKRYSAGAPSPLMLREDEKEQLRDCLWQHEHNELEPSDFRVGPGSEVLGSAFMKILQSLARSGALDERKRENGS